MNPQDALNKLENKTAIKKETKPRRKKEAVSRPSKEWLDIKSDTPTLIYPSNHERDLFLVIIFFVVIQAVSVIFFLWRISVTAKDSYNTGHQDGIIYQRENCL